MTREQIDRAIDEYLDDYELRSDDGDYTPPPEVKAVMKDAIMGLLEDDAFNAALSALPAEPVAIVSEHFAYQGYEAIRTGRLTIVPLKPMDESGLKLGDKLYAHHPREERIRDALKDAVDILEVLDASGKLCMAGSECLIKCRAALRESGTAQGFVSGIEEKTK